jgi:hypothetical protein
MLTDTLMRTVRIEVSYVFPDNPLFRNGYARAKSIISAEQVTSQRE